MTSNTLLRFASVIVFTLAFSTLASAQAPQRTFVSAQHGDDTNVAASPPRNVTQPCRQFSVAIGAVLAGGEVVAIDTGGYGPFSISKAVTVAAPNGVYASVRAQTAGTSAILVNAAGTDTVVIRGLTLVGVGGQEGIYVTSVRNLHVEGCVISGFSNIGINVNLTADGSHIFVNDTIMRNNGQHGISIQTSTGLVNASIDNSRSERNGASGFYAYNNSRVTINRSVATGNIGGSGFQSFTNAVGATAQLMCEGCVSSNNGGDGFIANPSAGIATMRVGHSAATNNPFYGFRQLGAGVFHSLGNNFLDGNASGETNVAITVVAVH